MMSTQTAARQEHTQREKVVEIRILNARRWSPVRKSGQPSLHFSDTHSFLVASEAGTLPRTNDRMDFSRSCDIIVPSMKRPLEATAKPTLVS